jgi:hypothetical protein
MALCNGHFSYETIQKIKANPDIEFLSQPCEKCGIHVVAKNYDGDWVPASHQMPPARKMKGRNTKR